MRLLMPLAIAAATTSWLTPCAFAQANAQPAMAEDLDVLANLFLPGAPLAQAVQSGCSNAYRTKRSRNADDLALESILPGVGEKMIAAASAHCDARVPAEIARVHDEIRAHWRATTSPADLHRLAILFGPSVREALGIRMEVRPGEMMTDAARRIAGPKEEDDAHFQDIQIAFAKTPGGAALIDRVSRYQVSMQARLASLQEKIAMIVKDAMIAAHRTANAYARKKGMTAPYLDQ